MFQIVGDAAVQAFEVRKDYETQLTTVVMTGPVTPEGVIEVLRAEIYGDTKKALWDFSDADLSGLNARDMTAISETAKPLDTVRDIAAISILVGDDASAMLVKLYVEMSKVVSLRSIPYYVTTSRPAAIAWLDGIVGIPEA